jgi:hypothetical protein
VPNLDYETDFDGNFPEGMSQNIQDLAKLMRTKIPYLSVKGNGSIKAHSKSSRKESTGLFLQEARERAEAQGRAA